MLTYQTQSSARWFPFTLVFLVCLRWSSSLIPYPPDSYVIKYQIDATKLLPMTSQRDVIFKKMITQTHIYIHKQKESNNSADENEMNSEFAEISHKTVFRKGREEKSFWVWPTVFLQDAKGFGHLQHQTHWCIFTNALMQLFPFAFHLGHVRDYYPADSMCARLLNLHSTSSKTSFYSVH